MTTEPMWCRGTCDTEGDPHVHASQLVSEALEKPTVQETAAVMEMLGDWCRVTGARDLPASMMGDILGDMAAAIQRVRAVMKK